MQRISRAHIPSPHKIVVCSIAAFVIVLQSVQCYADTWAKSYGGNKADRGQVLRTTPDGGYVVAGTTESFGSGSSDILVLKLDRTGGIQWQKSYGGVWGESPAAIATTKDGGFVLATTSVSFTNDTVAGGSTVWVVRLNASGDVLWQKSYEGSNTDGASAIAESAKGLIVVAGNTSSFGSEAPPNAWVLVLNPQGQIVWQKAYATSGVDAIQSVLPTADGGYIAVGRTGSGATPDVWVLKLEATGNVEWQRYLGGTGVEMAYSVQGTKDRGCIITGYTSSYGSGGTDGLIVKLNHAGEIEWKKTYGGANDEFLRETVQTADGGYIAIGSTNSYGNGGHDYWVVKLDQKGDIVWQRTFGGPRDDFGSSVQQGIDGKYVVVGTTASFGSGGDDVLVVKLDSNGNIIDCEGHNISCSALKTSSAVALDIPSVFNASIASTVNTTAGTKDTAAKSLGVKLTPRYIVSCFPPQADLTIQSLDHCPLTPTTTDTIIFTAVVKNVGGQRTPKSKLSFQVGGETNPQIFEVPELEGCQTYKVRRQTVLETAQRYRNTVVVDYDNNVSESNEGNNQKTEEYEVVLDGL